MHTVYATLVDVTGTSGQNVYSREVAVALAKQESVNLTVICPQPVGDLPESLLAENVTNRFLPPKQSSSLRWHVMSQKPMVMALEGARKQDDIDGMVAPLKPSLIIPPLFARVHSVPQVLLVEGMMARNVRELSPFPGAGRLAEIIAILNASTSACIFTAYEEAQQWITSLKYISEDRIRTFHHGVNFDEMQPMAKRDARAAIDFDVNDGAFVIGFVGSFKSYHRLDLLIEAASTMKSAGIPIHLLFVGEGPQMETIKNETSSLDIGEAVTFTGFVKHEQINKYIAACDVLYGVVDPSHWGSPMKVYEYLACERPVLAYDSDELQFVEQRGFGELIAEMSVESVEDALNSLWNTNTEKKEEMGKEAREYILANRTWDTLAREIIQCLQQSCSSQSPG